MFTAIAYKILKKLNNKYNENYTFIGELISPEVLKCNPLEWRDVMEELYREGYITGIYVNTDILGNKEFNIANAKITLKGADYLKTNSAFNDFRNIATDVISIASSIK